MNKIKSISKIKTNKIFNKDLVKDTSDVIVEMPRFNDIKSVSIAIESKKYGLYLENFWTLKSIFGEKFSNRVPIEIKNDFFSKPIKSEINVISLDEFVENIFKESMIEVFWSKKKNLLFAIDSELIRIKAPDLKSIKIFDALKLVNSINLIEQLFEKGQILIPENAKAD